jgi:tRNA-Thr(GGU) m(6)t(6)A37 methyltransferase TsaA
MEQEQFTIKTIGKIRIEGNDPTEAKYFIDIAKQYRSALKELDKFSHVMVFWWAHQNDKEEIRNSSKWTTTPPYGEDTPDTGIFATRAEYRPNPIMVTTTAISEVDEKEGIVKIEGIDAFNGTPIIDLKAYFQICDRIRNCHIAPWLKDWPEWQEDGAQWWAEQRFFDE